MAVYTHLNSQQIEDFLNMYDCGALVSFLGIQAGVENTNYKITTTKSDFILTLFEKRTPVSDIPFIFSFKKYLSSCGVVCPVPVPDRQGQVLQKLADRPASIISFLEGHGASQVDITPMLCRDMGEMTARLHLASVRFTESRVNPVGFETWNNLAQKIILKADTIDSTLIKFLFDELHFLESHWVTEKHQLPIGVVHADLFPDNIFIRDKKIFGIIDFYFSSTEAFIYDLMLTVGAWCFDEQGNACKDCMASFFEGYNALRPLSEVENKMLLVAGRAAAFRIFITRLHDTVFHDSRDFVLPKNPAPYMNISRHYHE